MRNWDQSRLLVTKAVSVFDGVGRGNCIDRNRGERNSHSPLGPATSKMALLAHTFDSSVSLSRTTGNPCPIEESITRRTDSKLLREASFTVVLMLRWKP